MGNYHLENGQSIALKSYQNIYITSDEEIKVGDWFFDSIKGVNYGIYKHVKGFINKTSKKIILTTDDQLIQVSVQAIDDNFLEWFVKNPSCERVEIDIQRIFGRSSPLDTLGQTFITYKITNYEK